MSVPVCCSNRAVPMCESDPLPCDAKFSLPGFCLRWAMKSLSEFDGTDGCAVMTFDAAAIRPTGAKSFCSQVIFVNIDGLPTW